MCVHELFIQETISPSTSTYYPRHHPINLTLHLSKPNIPTSLTLKVIKQRGQAHKLCLTRRPPRSRAMIQLLPMRAIIQMLIQAAQRTKLPMTQVALITIPIPGTPTRGILAVVFEEVISDDAVGVEVADEGVDGTAI